MVLTPGHFLTGDSLLAPPAPEIEKLNLTERWENCQFHVQQFWKRWRAEYLDKTTTKTLVGSTKIELACWRISFDQG